jgi:hypothetical protein
MNPRLYKVLASVIMGLGLIVLLFFRNYNGTWMPHPLLIFGLGLAVYILGFVLVRRAGRNEIKFKRERLLKERETIKSNSTKQIQIKLAETKILDNNYHKEVNYSPELTEWILMPGYFNQYQSFKKNKKQHISQTVLQYTDIETGEKYFSPVLNNDSKVVLFHISDQDLGTIYIDEKHDFKYYFDIEELISKINNTKSK